MHKLTFVDVHCKNFNRLNVVNAVKNVKCVGLFLLQNARKLFLICRKQGRNKTILLSFVQSVSWQKGLTRRSAKPEAKKNDLLRLHQIIPRVQQIFSLLNEYLH